MRTLEGSNRTRTGLVGIILLVLVIGVGQSFASVPMIFATPTFYAQFTDKQHVFLEAQQQGSQDIQDACARAYFSAKQWPERVWRCLSTLVEVIAAEGSDPAAVNTVFAYTRKLGKTPILVKDTPGFLVNRLLMFYSTEALWLLDEGHRIEDLDRAMADWGMPMGPMALTDEVGIDVAVKVAHILGEAFGDRLPLPSWLDNLAAGNRLGTKTGRGFYHYAGRERKDPDAAVYGLLGLTPTIDHPDPAALADRMVLPMVNEAARCLEEKVVGGPGDLDLALILGTGFPPFRGGLCRWADGQGLPTLVAALERLEGTVGDRFRPSEALRSYAAAGGFYAASS